MTTRRVGTVVFAALVTLSAFAVAAHAAVPATKTVSASQWVKSVCAAEAKLKSSVTSQLNALNAAGARGDVAAEKTAFVDLVGHVPNAIKTLVSSINKAGVPKTTNGKQIVQTYVSTLNTIEKTLVKAKSTIEGLPTTNASEFASQARSSVKTDTVTMSANQKVKTLDTQGKLFTSLQGCGGVFSISGGGGSSQSTNGQGGSSSPSSGSGPSSGTPPPST
jgi:hypothetical protein